MKDQIGTYFYFPSTNFQKAAGGFGPIRVNNRITVNVPFDEPEDEFDLLIGDWYEQSFEEVRSNLGHRPTWMLMNGKGPFNNSLSKTHESFTVSQGKTYRIRISNVGTTWSFNFRIQNHEMVLVELEGSYVDKITVDSLDVHVGQSYSILVTADQDIADYYIVATPKMVDVTNQTNLVGVGVLHYVNSTTPPCGPLPQGPDPFDIDFSRSQAESIRWNLTTGAARPNPQGSFNISNLTLTQTFILDGLAAEIHGVPRFTVNNVSYIAPNTSLKLADYYLNGSGVYLLDSFPVNRTLAVAVNGTFVATGYHKGVVEMVFVNNGSDKIESWHLDGFGFFVVGYGIGEWNPEFRNSTYNLYDPVYRSTVQVYPGGWTAVRVYLDNPGMWNLRSQLLKNWYLGQELYIRVYDPDNNEAKEFPPPPNQLFCGLVQAPPMPPPVFPPPVSPPNPKPSDSPPHSSSAATTRIGWLLIIMNILAIL